MKHINKFLTLALAFILILSLAACSSKEKETNKITESPKVSLTPDETENIEVSDENQSNTPTPTADPNRIFTLAELSAFHGRDEQPAYVAVDGIVYDLTNSSAWKDGKHNGFTAGTDLTEEIKEVSPHGIKNLEGIKIVGKLASD